METDNKLSERKEFEDKIVEINRVSRTVAGGRRIRFRSVVVIGNKSGKVGLGIGKADDVSASIQNAIAKAKRNLIKVPIVGQTLPYQVVGQYSTNRVLLRPARLGSSVIAGSSVRILAQLAGIDNLVSKVYGSRNPINIIRATFKAFGQVTDLHQQYGDPSWAKSKITSPDQPADKAKQSHSKSQSKPAKKKTKPIIKRVKKVKTK